MNWNTDSVPVISREDRQSLKNDPCTLEEARSSSDATKEVPAYALTLEKGALNYVTSSPEVLVSESTTAVQKRLGRISPTCPDPRATLMVGCSWPSSPAVQPFSRPVVDRTGFTDTFSFLICSGRRSPLRIPSFAQTLRGDHEADGTQTGETKTTAEF
jgi:hypothetical protein